MSELAKALVKAQSEIGAAQKSSKNPHFNNKYADLSEVWSAWQDVGPKNGLAVVQVVRVREDGKQALITRMMHTSGESIESEILILPTKSDMQGIGSAITYCRRYALAAMAGIVQDDDDGNAASAKPDQNKPSQQKTQPAVSRTKAWVDSVIEKLSAGDIAFTDWEIANVKQMAALQKTDAEQHQRLIDFLTNGTKEAA